MATAPHTPAPPTGEPTVLASAWPHACGPACGDAPSCEHCGACCIMLPTRCPMGCTPAQRAAALSADTDTHVAPADMGAHAGHDWTDCLMGTCAP